jgi:hypothetical protein
MAKAAIEIGKIAKTDVVRHRADAVVIKARIAQHPVRSRKALAEHMGEDEAATSARRQDASCELLMWR